MSIQTLIDLAKIMENETLEARLAREARLAECRIRAREYDAKIEKEVRGRIPTQESLNRAVNFGALYD